MANELNIEKLQTTFLLISDYLKEQLLSELIAQGHKATGALIDSIEHKILSEVNFMGLDGYAEFYGRFVDTGRKAGVKRVPISALEEWIKVKGFESDAKKVRGMAFAIQRTIFDKGISTPQSWAGESTKGWMTKTLAENEQRISADIAEAIGAGFDFFVENLVRETQSQFVTQ